MQHRVETLACTLALALGCAAPASAAITGAYTDHRPLAFTQATPSESLGHAVTAVAAGRDMRADAWLEHCEVQLLNARALDLAMHHENAATQPLATTPALQDLEHARGDLLAGKPRVAQHNMDAAVPLMSRQA